MNRSHHALRPALAALAALTLSACTSLAPTYTRPAAPVAAHWPADTTADTTGRVAADQLAWPD